ncbi:MAG: hypothetical protein ACTSU2_01995 [Promethearchaeota archaeon]
MPKKSKTSKKSKKSKKTKKTTKTKTKHREEVEIKIKDIIQSLEKQADQHLIWESYVQMQRSYEREFNSISRTPDNADYLRDAYRDMQYTDEQEYLFEDMNGKYENYLEAQISKFKEILTEEDQPEDQCANCHKAITTKNICESCGRYFCDSCLVKCRSCGKIICPDCVSGLSEIFDETLCLECGEDLINGDIADEIMDRVISY